MATRNQSIVAAAVLLLPALGWSAPPKSDRLDVPFLKQEKNGCGPTSVAMVLGYWSDHSGAHSSRNSAPDLYRELGVNENKGSALSDMKRSFESRGYRAFTIKASWTDLQEQIAKGRPVIATLGRKRGQDLHFAVVAGIEEGRLWLNDPARKKPIAVDRKKFEESWAKADHWTLLAVPNPN